MKIFIRLKCKHRSIRIAAEKCYGRIESATQSEREKEMENNNLILLISDLLHGIAYTISDEL